MEAGWARHDLLGEDGKAKRGWSGVAVMAAGGEKVEIKSAVSD